MLTARPANKPLWIINRIKRCHCLPPTPPTSPTLSTNAHINLLRGAMEPTQWDYENPAEKCWEANNGKKWRLSETGKDRKRSREEAMCTSFTWSATIYLTPPPQPPFPFFPLYTRPHPFPSTFGLGLDRLSLHTVGQQWKLNKVRKDMDAPPPT